MGKIADKIAAKRINNLANGIDLIGGLGLEQYASMVGDVPAWVEVLEYTGMNIQDQLMTHYGLTHSKGLKTKDEFGVDEWQDKVIRLDTQKVTDPDIRYYLEMDGVKDPIYLPLRVGREKSYSAEVLMTGDQLELTPLEHGVARLKMAIINMIRYLQQHGEGELGSKHTRFAMFTYDEQRLFRLLRVCDAVIYSAHMIKVHRILD